MTYFKNPQVDATMIEVTLSSAQTASQGDFVLFDTIRATGSHGVSVNSSTGELSLDTLKKYYIQASIHVDRSSTTSSWRFAWVDSSGNEISAADGGYDAEWTYHGATTTTNVPTATFTAVYQPNPDQVASPIRLKATLLNAASSILTNTRLFIVEAKA
jgi:hypothetical protein